MRLLFEGWGCKVHTHSGSKSIEDAGRLLTPDIILADYHLDGETGLDLIRKLRARFGETIPAVLVTADRSNEVRAAADRLDVSVINKPLKPAVLRSLMTRLSRMTPAAAE
jgi:CheY-like chemotaxis protein